MTRNQLQKEQNIVQAGFTLVELMVSVTLFTIAMVISISTLLVIIDANAKAQAVNTAMTNLSFAVDSMTRNIRTGFKHYCGSLTGNNFPDNDSATTRDCVTGMQADEVLTFTREIDKKRVGYRLENNTIEQRIKGDNGSDDTGWLAITSSDIVIDRFVPTVVGSGGYPGNYEQPDISIVIEGHVNSGPDSETHFSLQTRVVQRIIDL